MKKNKKIVIFGNTLLAQTVCDYFTVFSEYEVVAFTVDKQYIQDSTFYDHTIAPFEDIEILYPPSEYDLFVAVGSSKLNAVRATIFKQAKAKGYYLPTFIHPLAYIAPHVTIGENCLIMEYARVLTRSKLENNIIIWPGGSVSHDCVIHDNAYIVSGMGGFCEIGENSFIGMSSTIADHVVVAPNSFITMGTVIRKNTKENSIYTGNPAKRNKYVSAIDYFSIQ